MSNPHLDELLRLPAAERLAAIEELWDSLDAETELFPLTDDERTELDQRVAADETDRDDTGITWPELRRRLERGEE